MKKIMFPLVLAMLTFSLVGCGDDSDSSKDDQNQPTTSETQTDEKTAKKKKTPKQSKQEKYERDVQSQVALMGSTFQSLGDLFTNQKLENDQWREKVLSNIEYLKTNIEQSRELKAPDSYEQANEEFQKGIDDLEWITKNLPAAIESKDEKTINQAAEKFSSVSTHIQKAQKLMK
jgi:hypothetical protein